MSKKGKVLHPFEHALKRPDTYIGSAKTVLKDVWIWDPDKKCATLSKIRYNPGLFNINREIGSNIEDNKWRSEQDPDSPPMKKIEITTDELSGRITFRNDGYCIPVRKEEYTFQDFRRGTEVTESLYPAELFFGEMGSGTNFNDDEERKTSGRNGMGAKAANVFSTEFKVEHSSPTDKKIFTQKYWDNGKSHSEPEIKTCRRKTGYTEISFVPDYSYFNYPTPKDPGLDQNFINVLRMYAYEMAMVTGLPVVFNGERLVVKDLEAYARLFFPNKKESKMARFVSPSGDECVVVESGDSERDSIDTVANVAFVNGIHTSLGGVHVEEWENLLIRAFVTLFNKRKPKKGTDKPLKVSGDLVKPYLTFFIRCEVDKPEFSNQPKDMFTGIDESEKPPKEREGYKVIYKSVPTREAKAWRAETNKILTKMLKWEFVALLEEKLIAKDERSRAKKEGTNRKVNLGKKLNDANKAGGKESHKCILYITEGLSAKAFAVRGIGYQRSQDYCGVYAIKGKLMNVKKHSRRAVNNNQEIQDIIKILGLRSRVDYRKKENFKTLRYGKVRLLTDQDDDGFHIRGLLLYFFYVMYPTLLDINYVDSFSTAVVKVNAGKGAKKEVLRFYSNPEWKKWWETVGSEKKTSRPEYYKGLGSIDLLDIPYYFRKPKIVEYYNEGDEDEYLELGFGERSSNWRKEWISRDMKKNNELEGWIGNRALEDDLEEDSSIDFDSGPDSDPESDRDSGSESGPDQEPDFVYEGKLGISSFVDQQLIIYHRMALRRSLPCIWDGFKEGQRKTFYAIRASNYTFPRDLERVSGAVKEKTGYHHGAASLTSTLIKMGQGFVGSNNIPLLINKGEFGTRWTGGKDSAQARYPSTMLEKIANAIFPPMDDVLLKHQIEDGQEVEFQHYMPILPMILVNGAEGISSGWSTKIPCYNPEDLVKWIRLWLKRGDSPESPDSLEELKPWYRGFKGSIELVRGKSEKPKGWISKGILEKEKGWWHVRELPIGLWTAKFKEWIEYLTYKTVPKGKRWPKLDRRFITSLKEYNTANTVHYMFKPAKDFLPDMDTPKNFKILQSKQSLENMVAVDENDYPYRFERAEDILRCFCHQRLKFYQKRKDYFLEKWKKDLVKDQNRYRFVKAVGIDRKLDLHSYADDSSLESAMETAWKFDKVDGTFDYLLGMQVRSLTRKKAEELQKSINKLKKQIQDLEKKSLAALWEDDLDKFEAAYKKFLRTRKEELSETT